MKLIVAPFNQEKALVGSFSVITNLCVDLRFQLYCTLHTALPSHGGQGTIASCNDTEYRDLDLDTDLAYTKHHRNKEP